MKTVTQKQLDLVKDMSREELILATAPHIDLDSPAMQADLKRIQGIAISEAAEESLERDPEDYDDFDWNSDQSVVLRDQRATAIYRNPFEGIVIRQRKHWPDEESDPYMIITEENAVTFMEALAKVARE